MDLPGRTPRSAILVLVALTLLGLAARVIGIGSQLPHNQEPLAIIVWQSAARDIPEGKQHHTFAYPSTFYPYLLSGALDVLPGHSYARQAPAGAPLEEHLAAASGPFLRGRILIALISVLMIPGTFLLARRWLEPSWSLLAAALMATSLLALRYSVQARPHCAVASLSLLAVLAALHLLRTGKLSSYVLAGIASALAAASLYTGLFVLPALFLAAVFAPVRSRATRWLGFGAALAIVGIGIRLAYPFLFEPRGIASEGGHLDLAEQHIPWDRFDGRGFEFVLRGLWGFDPVLTALACGAVVLGLAALVSRRTFFTTEERRAAWVAGSQALCMFLAFGALNETLPRFVIPILPACAVLGAVTVRWAVRLATNRVARGEAKTRSAIGAGVALGILALPAYACARLVWLNARPDTAGLAAQWIEEHVGPEDALVVNVPLSLPIAQDPSILAMTPAWATGQWEQYLRDWGNDAGLPRRPVHRCLRPGFLADKLISRAEVRLLLDAVRPRWVVVAINSPQASSADETRTVMREIAGEPVARFWPASRYEPARPLYFEAGFHQLVDLLVADRHGSPIEIYRLDERD